MAEDATDKGGEDEYLTDAILKLAFEVGSSHVWSK